MVLAGDRPMSKAGQTALEIKKTADELGWKLYVRPSGVLTIIKHITPNDNDAFVQADGEYYSILGMVPQSAAGSMWGTDGGGIGALTAARTGVFTMNKSGCNRNVLKALLVLEVI